MRILYADDDLNQRRYLGLAAERTGHDVVIVQDGALAWELVEQGEHFDLIISDHDMPEMNGLELLKKVRSNPATVETPFVLYTGNDSSELKSAVNNLKGIFEDKGAMRSKRDLITENLPQL